jgi:hypothetical protein
MDYEFESKIINPSVLKWDMVAKKYNNGFLVKKKLLAGAEEDIVFPALPESETEITGSRLQGRWETVSKHFR